MMEEGAPCRMVAMMRGQGRSIQAVVDTQAELKH
jgi:hypothetical protein